MALILGENGPAPCGRMASHGKMKTTTIMSPMVHSDSINGIINDAEHVIAQVLTDAKSLYPWLKYSGEFVTEDILLETLCNLLTGHKTGN